MYGLDRTSEVESEEEEAEIVYTHQNKSSYTKRDTS